MSYIRGSADQSASAPITFVKCSIHDRSIVNGVRGAYRDLLMLVSRVNWLSRLTKALRELDPYVAIELVLPGGSWVLACLWAFRQRRWFVAHARRTLAIVLFLGATLPGPQFDVGVIRRRLRAIRCRETQRFR
jgi:hypothetical protein